MPTIAVPSQLIEDLRHLILQEMGVTFSHTPSLSLDNLLVDDLELDALNIASLICEVEEHFHIELTDEEIEALTDIASLAKCIHSKLPTEAGSPTGVPLMGRVVETKAFELSVEDEDGNTLDLTADIVMSHNEDGTWVPRIDEIYDDEGDALQIDDFLREAATRYIMENYDFDDHEANEDNDATQLPADTDEDTSANNDLPETDPAVPEQPIAPEIDPDAPAPDQPDSAPEPEQQ